MSYYESLLGDIRAGKFNGLWNETWSDFRKVLPYLIVGIAVGRVIYGFVPADLLAAYAGDDNPFAIPIAAVIGAPLYIRAEAVIPLAAALLGKGVSAGAVMALIIGSAGASLTELILLKSLFRWPLVAVFLAVVIGMAISAGYATLFAVLNTPDTYNGTFPRKALVFPLRVFLSTRRRCDPLVGRVGRRAFCCFTAS